MCGKISYNRHEEEVLGELTIHATIVRVNLDLISSQRWLGLAHGLGTWFFVAHGIACVNLDSGLSQRWLGLAHGLSTWFVVAHGIVPWFCM